MVRIWIDPSKLPDNEESEQSVVDGFAFCMIALGAMAVGGVSLLFMIGLAIKVPLLIPVYTVMIVGVALIVKRFK